MHLWVWPHIPASLKTETQHLPSFPQTPMCIIGSGPAAHTAAVYAARAELQPILFEGWMANNIAAGGQLTTTTDVENFPGYPEGIHGSELTDRFRKQSERFGTKIFTETVTKVGTWSCDRHQGRQLEHWGIAGVGLTVSSYPAVVYVNVQSLRAGAQR